MPSPNIAVFHKSLQLEFLRLNWKLLASLLSLALALCNGDIVYNKLWSLIT